ncbi:invasion associated locus B family protein [Rhizobium sp. RU36D]|uniref:invasion associated locus B family protein n=1 Tax=Rhizobium sp. RU36D TaxID=1907415 RepID=UPI0009D7A84A|nr:invasion associated locus B family protein [Rhizobium sp. RU36D]SMC91370.1 Invasion protein IalB, involved in pathogenesis [Rhizobium sp. RU36D]
MGFNSFARVVLAAAAIAVSGSQVNAQTPGVELQKGTNRSDYGAWSMICETPAGAAAEQCALTQFAIADDRPEMGIAISVLKTADRQKRLMRILVPLGVWLYDGVDLYVDGTSIGRTYFTRCYVEGCNADVVIEDELLKILRAGKDAVFAFKESPDQENRIGIPIDLSGFGSGYDALP